MELEPNNTPDQATPLLLDDVRVTGNIYPNADLDLYSFEAQAGDRVFAAVMTSWSASLTSDSLLRILGTNGVDVIELDDDDGTFSSSSSSIAGCLIPGDGRYFIEVRHWLANQQLRPYDLWFRLRRGSPAAEVEPNDVAPGQALSATGWVSGTISTVADTDLYSLALNAGDTVFLSLDANPVRGADLWNARVGLGPFDNVTLVVNDSNAGASNSEAFFMTVKEAGQYTALVSSGGSGFGPYLLNISVLPASTSPSTTYASTNVPMAILDAGMVVSTLSVPDSRRIGRLAVNLSLNHSSPLDLDVTLTAPDGNTVTLLTDVGSASQTNWNFGLRDDAGLPVGTYAVMSQIVYRTKSISALDWFRGQNAQGTWTLAIRDDAAGNTGTLLGWNLVITDPPPDPAGPTTTVFSTTFEADGGGFTHSGTADEWEWGTPVFAPITNCHSGTRCWVTDLDNTYDVNASADLFSPNIDLTGYRPSVPIFLRWAMKHHLESASFDHAYVEVQEVGGGGTARKVWEWMGATQYTSMGLPSTNVQQAAGWGLHRAIISDFAGRTIRARFHLDSDSSGNYGGLAIDDVSVTAHPGILRNGDNVNMNFMGVPGRPYRIHRATNLLTGTWSDVAPPALVIAPECSAFPYVSTNPPPMMHYRLAPNP